MDVWNRVSELWKGDEEQGGEPEMSQKSNGEDGTKPTTDTQPPPRDEGLPTKAQEEGQSWDSWNARKSTNTPEDKGKWAEDPCKEGWHENVKKGNSSDSWEWWNASNKKEGARSDSSWAWKGGNEPDPWTDNAIFKNGGAWWSFDEVDMAPGRNEYTWKYKAEEWSKEAAIEEAKSMCMKHNHIGFVVVEEWGTLFYKNEKHVGRPSTKHCNKDKGIQTHVWLTREQVAPWQSAAAKAKGVKDDDMEVDESGK